MGWRKRVTCGDRMADCVSMMAHNVRMMVADGDMMAHYVCIKVGLYKK